MLVYDYYCNGCDRDFEAFVKTSDESVLCTTCGVVADRLTPAPTLRYLEMGVDPTMSTSADKWANAREQKIRMENKHLGEE